VRQAIGASMASFIAKVPIGSPTWTSLSAGTVSAGCGGSTESD
jgi:hypothetical protein